MKTFVLFFLISQFALAFDVIDAVTKPYSFSAMVYNQEAKSETSKICNNPIDSYYSCEYKEPIEPVLYYSNKYRIKFKESEAKENVYNFKESTLGKALTPKFYIPPHTPVDSTDPDFQPFALKGNLQLFLTRLNNVKEKQRQERLAMKKEKAVVVKTREEPPAELNKLPNVPKIKILL